MGMSNSDRVSSYAWDKCMKRRAIESASSLAALEALYDRFEPAVTVPGPPVLPVSRIWLLVECDMGVTKLPVIGVFSY